MKIKELLTADWTVDWLGITVRDMNTNYLMGHEIGDKIDMGPGYRLLEETEVGDIYERSGFKKMFINRIIQYRKEPVKAKGKEGCVGVELEKIPKELLELTIDHLRPARTGTSDGMHGYHISCKVDKWCGIAGENRQMMMDLEGV